MLKSLLLLLLLNGTSPLNADDRIHIKIGLPEFKKPVIAHYSKCSIKSCDDINELEQVFASDMMFSNVFILLSKNFYPETEQLNSVQAWRVSGAEYLLSTEIFSRYITATLTDLKTGSKIFSRDFTQENSIIDTTHTISNYVYNKLTGQKGVFKTQIAFIGEKDRIKNLYVMDYDGRRIKQLTFFKTIIVSPSWSPDGRFIAYTRYAPTSYRDVRGLIINPNLYMFDTLRNREKLISDVKGQNSGASWSPDGKKLVFTSARLGTPDIHVYDVDTGKTKLLIRNIGMSMEPSFSPDSKQVAFSSTRSGNPEIYIYNIDTMEQKRLTFSRHYNSSPAWSPAGDRIAFAGLDNPFGKRSYFDIFLLSPFDSSIERLTIDSGNNENPTWSPDARHLVYTSTRNKGSDIYFINSDGTGEKQLTKGIRAYSPSWSPITK